MHDDFNELRNRLSRIESASYSTHTGIYYFQSAHFVWLFNLKAMHDQCSL